MSSYEKHKSWGFQHTEWGPCAVENLCNIQNDNMHNTNTMINYGIGVMTFIGIFTLIAWSIG